MASLALSRPAAAQQTTPPATATARARDFLQRLRASTGTPAVSGAVAPSGEIVFSDGAGMIDIENQVPATGASVYNIGSVSKAVTAVAVMQLPEQKRIALGDDIRR